MTISNRLEFARDALTWGAPALGIPALRFFQDDKERRGELFVRDASTYSVGAVSFWATQYGVRRLLDRMAGQEIQVKLPRLLHSIVGSHFPKKAWEMPKNVETIKFIAFVTALAANITYAGVGAVRLSQWFKASTQSPLSIPNTMPQQSSPPGNPALPLSSVPQPMGSSVPPMSGYAASKRYFWA